MARYDPLYNGKFVENYRGANIYRRSGKYAVGEGSDPRFLDHTLLRVGLFRPSERQRPPAPPPRGPCCGIGSSSAGLSRLAVAGSQGQEFILTTRERRTGRGCSRMAISS